MCSSESNPANYFFKKCCNMGASVEQNLRIVIAELLFYAGQNASDIIRNTNFGPATIYRIVSNLRQVKCNKKKGRSLKSDTMRTKRFPEGFKWSIAANP